MPAMVRWPGTIPAGQVTEQPAITMDWTATILAVTGTAARSRVSAGRRRPDAGVHREARALRSVAASGAPSRCDARASADEVSPGRWGRAFVRSHVDPGEKNDLRARHPDTFADIRNSSWPERPDAAEAEGLADLLEAVDDAMVVRRGCGALPGRTKGSSPAPACARRSVRRPRRRQRGCRAQMPTSLAIRPVASRILLPPVCVSKPVQRRRESPADEQRNSQRGASTAPDEKIPEALPPRAATARTRPARPRTPRPPGRLKAGSPLPRCSPGAP